MTNRTGSEYIPFGKPNFSQLEIDAVTRVMKTGWIGMGNETIGFERELEAYLDAPHVVTVSSCTAALFLSLLVKGVREGDEVIVPSLTWCSTANAALYLGAKPVFCDVDSHSLNMTIELIKEKITRKTKAVVVVHYGGLAVDVEEFRNALSDDIVIIEDAAHAFGAKYNNGIQVGASGNLVCFSFYANKNLSTGEGGAIALADGVEADHLRSLRQHGMQVSAWNRFQNPQSILYSVISELGYKMNYTDLQAAIGRVQLARMGEMNSARSKIAEIYYRELTSVAGIIIQKDILDDRHARHLFPVLLPVDKMKIGRDEFIIQLRSLNIGASIHYAPLHAMPLYLHCNCDELHNTDYIGRAIMTLPISASMSEDEARFVVNTFKKMLNEYMQ